MADKNYKVVFPVVHDGKRYGVGESVKMSEEQAKPLVDRGTLAQGRAVDPNPGMPEANKGKVKEPEGKAVQKTEDPATKPAK